jgi:hypothetical protein
MSLVGRTRIARKVGGVAQPGRNPSGWQMDMDTSRATGPFAGKLDFHFSIDQEEENSRCALLRNDCLARSEVPLRMPFQNFKERVHTDEQ